MQDEINSRVVALSIRLGAAGARLTAHALKEAMQKYLAENERAKLQKAQKAPADKTRHGKQTVGQLMEQNTGLTNIEITDQNIKSFERIARKYNIDFALKKDKAASPPRYLVFFKARDVDVMNAAFKVLSKLRQRGAMTIIDQVTVELNLRYDYYEARFSNLGLGGVPISEEYPEKYDRLLCGGIWCIIQLEYNNEQDSDIVVPDRKPRKKNESLISIRKLTPIQMPHVDIEDLKQGRKAFTKDEWIDVLLRSIGMEPEELTYREKWLLLLRMIPLVENNFNLCELGPRSTGKSHLYKEISPNSILVSGGQTTVANLFYNMGKSILLKTQWQ